MIYVNIEYCEKWNYKPEFDRVSKIISSLKKDITVIGNAAPPRTGSFEVLIGNKLVFSKFTKDKFPSEPEIYSWFE